MLALLPLLNRFGITTHRNKPRQPVLACGNPSWSNRPATQLRVTSGKPLHAYTYFAVTDKPASALDSPSSLHSDFTLTADAAMMQRDTQACLDPWPKGMHNSTKIFIKYEFISERVDLTFQTACALTYSHRAPKRRCRSGVCAK